MIQPLAMVPECKSWRVRAYGEGLGDFQLIEGWMKAHGQSGFMEAKTPPTGVIVECDGEPVAAAWVYLSYGIGVGIIETLVTAPALSLSASFDAVGHAVESLKVIAKANDCGFLMGFTTPALARCASKRHGFTETNFNLTQIVSIL